MSERILRALMQLFAIIAQVDEYSEENADQLTKVKSTKGQRIIESFLRSELSADLVLKYLNLFEEYLNALNIKQQRKDGQKKRTSLNSVKVLRICSQINEELTQKQKIIVLIRIVEFIQSNNDVKEQEIEFVNTVADAFNIPKSEYDQIVDFILSGKAHIIRAANVLYILPPGEQITSDAKFIHLEGLDDQIRTLYIKSVNIMFFRYFGKDVTNLNGQVISNDRTNIFTQGATLRTHKSKHLYFSDLLSQFLSTEDIQKLTFSAQGITYDFRGGKKGLHTLNFIEETGKLVGIMGGSGTGKSTLLNVLNGSYKPTTGNITINGFDIYKDKDKLEGIIGFVSQDDLLIEELTVFQNLYFNAKLCFANLNEREIQRKVIDVLYSIGLHEVKDLVVGNPLKKTISGGQRKRLNIALELIREPEILFVDEPTSGLSSRDSENIMDLLKEMTFKGKLVFVVIHQPSSEIFKMLDRLLLIDQGGYPIFDGNPIDALVYFKEHTHHGNAEERECSICGNVNPEQIFNIIDTKIVDEYGNLTDNRKTTPEEWNQKFHTYKPVLEIENRDFLPKAVSKIPSRWSQFTVFFLRDLLSKLSNKQYVIITLLQAPLLAFVLSFFVKYFGDSDANGPVYSYFKNENIPQYIFIAVVVALFLGLTVAAEEIHKDKKILKRESFLNLSSGSYLFSKLMILIIVSGLQTFLYVLIGNGILEIKAMWWQYWLVLFSTSVVANLMGLNISSAFNSAKVIYIIVPILIIPQLLFSGVIVKFDKLHPILSKSTEVPWIGELMVSRWSYEAICVVQSVDNQLEQKFFEINQKKYDAAWKKDFWLPEMNHYLQVVNNTDSSVKERIVAAEILSNEIKKEQKIWSNLACNQCLEILSKVPKTNKYISTLEIADFLSILKNQYILEFNEQNDNIEALKRKMGIENYQNARNEVVNEALQDIVTNRLESNKILVYNNQLYRKDNPIYLSSENVPLFHAHYFSPYKSVMGVKLSTFWTNIIILWLFAAFLFVTLYYNWLKKFIKTIEYYNDKIKKPLN